jgi:hypothetical protein
MDVEHINRYISDMRKEARKSMSVHDDKLDIGCRWKERDDTYLWYHLGYRVQLKRIKQVLQRVAEAQ